MADEFFLKMHVTFRDLLHAVNLRHGTNGFTSLPKEGVLRIFFALKNPMASAGFEPANLGTKGQHATSRPPKPLIYSYITLFPFTKRCFFQYSHCFHVTVFVSKKRALFLQLLSINISRQQVPLCSVK